MERMPGIGVFSGRMVELPKQFDKRYDAKGKSGGKNYYHLNSGDMKKIILITMLGTIFLSGSSYATENKSSATAPTAVWIKLLITFHRPKFNCESGFSICLLVTWGLEAPVGSSEKGMCAARGKLNERNQLIVEVNEDELTRYEGGAALRYFKDKTSIPIPDPYALPEATCRALGSAAPLVIRQGNYPVTFQNGTYTVVFQL